MVERNTHTHTHMQTLAKNTNTNTGMTHIDRRIPDISKDQIRPYVIGCHSVVRRKRALELKYVVGDIQGNITQLR